VKARSALFKKELQVPNKSSAEWHVELEQQVPPGRLGEMKMVPIYIVWQILSDMAALERVLPLAADDIANE
jgi:hypothetical protein